MLSHRSCATGLAAHLSEPTTTKIKISSPQPRRPHDKQSTPTTVAMKCKSRLHDNRCSRSSGIWSIIPSPTNHPFHAPCTPFHHQWSIAQILTCSIYSPQGRPCCHHHPGQICRQEGRQIFTSTSAQDREEHRDVWHGLIFCED